MYIKALKSERTKEKKITKCYTNQIRYFVFLRKTQITNTITEMRHEKTAQDLICTNV